MEILNNFSSDTIELLINDSKLDNILDLIKFKQLIKLDCSKNQITNLYNLPSTLT